MKIKPFTACEPQETWYIENMSESPGANLVQVILEPISGNVNTNESCKATFKQLLEKGNYKESESPSIYIYEKKSIHGTQLAIWTLTSLDDFKQGNIMTHEQTILAHESQLKTYREEVGIEGHPVILTYHRNTELTLLIENLTGQKPYIKLKQNQNHHKIWKISEPSTIREFQEVFETMDRVYVADGHHRLAAASKVHSSQPQWITTLYISACQLICKEFHRLVSPAAKLCPDYLFSYLNKYFYISTIPNNSAYKPNQKRRFGMKYNDTWYQLDLKPADVQQRNATDVELLQNLILAPIFGIDNPEDDHRILYFPADHWENMLRASKLRRNSVIFTTYPITADELIEKAEQFGNLPPKSTYIEPKIPYGLLLYQNKAAMKTEKENA